MLTKVELEDKVFGQTFFAGSFLLANSQSELSISLVSTDLSPGVAYVVSSMLCPDIHFAVKI